MSYLWLFSSPTRKVGVSFLFGFGHPRIMKNSALRKNFLGCIFWLHGRGCARSGGDFKSTLFDMRRPASFFLTSTPTRMHSKVSPCGPTTKERLSLALLISLCISDEGILSKAQTAAHHQIDRQWWTLYNSSSTSSWAWPLNTTLISPATSSSGTALSSPFSTYFIFGMDKMAVLRHGASTKGRRLHNFEIDFQPIFFTDSIEKTRACFLKQLVLPLVVAT